MIVAAGRGERLRPLTALRAKPALPVRGLPLVAYQLALLAHHGVTEVVINTHHLPRTLEEAARRHAPAGVSVHFSREPELLGTGGGIRRVAGFLRESDPSLVLGGDMILDVDLSALVARHRERGDAATLLARDDRRAESFGTLGVDAQGCLRRIGRRFDLGGETTRGVYIWANVFASRCFDSLPERQVFSHLDDWLAPCLAAGARDIRAEVAGPERCAWTPVGTPREYLEANLQPRSLSYLDADAEAERLGTRFHGDLVLGAGAVLGPRASLDRAVVWEGEQVPAGLVAGDGVFAGGSFHPCDPASGGADAS